MAGPKRIPGLEPKKKATAMDKYLNMAKKNPGTSFVLFGLVAFFLFILLSTPKTEQQAQAEDNMNRVTSQLKSQYNSARKVVARWADSQDRTDAFAMYGSFTPWQRQSTISEIGEYLGEKDFAGSVALVLNAPDLKRLFGTATPDLHSKEFAAEAENLGKLLDAWLEGSDSTQAVMGEDAFDTFAEIIENGFWGGMEIFSASDKRYYSGNGWRGARSAFMGRFFLRFKTAIKEKAEAVAKGEDLEWPEEPEPEPEWKDEEGADDVIFSTDTSFEADVKSKTHAIVMFYAPWCGHCKRFKPDYQKTASMLSEYDVVLAAVDATQQRKLRKKYEIGGFPTTLYFKNGAKVSTFEDDRSTYGILKFLSDEGRLGAELNDLVEEHKPIPEVHWSEEEGPIIHMTDASFAADIAAKQHSLVMFYAPWCGHCKAFKPAYAEAADTLGDDCTIGAVDATGNKALADKFDVTGYPTIIYFENGEEVEKYNMARDATTVVNYMVDKIGKTEL